MDKKEIIKQFIMEEFLSFRKEIRLNDETNLLLDGIVDSIGLLRLVAFIEDRFGIKVPFQDITIEHFHSLQSLADYLETKGSAALRTA